MRKLVFALAAVPLLLGAGAVPASAADSTRVRLVYLSPDHQLGNIDYYIDGKKVLSNADYTVASTYSTVDAGQHTFAVRKAGAPDTATPDAQVDQSLAAGYYSVFVGGKVGSSTCPIKAVVFNDDFATPPAGQAAARFVHMAPEVPGVDVILNKVPSTVLFKNVSCFQGSSYSTFPTDKYPVALVATGKTNPTLFTADADLTRAGQVITFVGAGGVDEKVSMVRLLDAASAGNSPQGGAATGEGGAAFRGLLPLGLITGSLLACALLLLFVRRSPA